MTIKNVQYNYREIVPKQGLPMIDSDQNNVYSFLHVKNISKCFV